MNKKLKNMKLVKVKEFKASEFAKINDIQVSEIKNFKDSKPAAKNLKKDDILVAFEYENNEDNIVKIYKKNGIYEELTEVIVGSRWGWNLEEGENFVDDDEPVEFWFDPDPIV